MLMPRKVAHRKHQRGRLKGNSKGASSVTFGDYGIQALEPGWLTARQIEAARIAMTRHVRRGGKVWIYRGDIVPYKTPPDVAQAAALAAGDPTGGPKPRRVVSSSAAARRRSTSETVEVTAAPEELDETVAPLVKEADPEFERLLAEEEEIERSTRDHHETPHFRMDD